MQETTNRAFLYDLGGYLATGFILICVSVSLLAYVIAPDNSVNANQMHLSIHSQPPGFEVKMLHVPTNALNYQEYVSELEADRTYAAKFDAVKEYNNNLEFTIAPAHQERITADSIFREKRERWFSDLTADFYVEEAVNILDHLKVGIYQQEPLAKK